MDYFALGYRVRQQRNRLQLTQEQLAEKVNISTSFLGHIERGSRKASLETLTSLCNALNVSADYLLADSLNTTLTSQVSDDLSNEKKYVLREIFQTMQETMDKWNDNPEE